MSKQRDLKFRVWDGERMIVPDNGEHVIFWNDPKDGLPNPDNRTEPTCDEVAPF